jgi:hypothetical protein
LGILRRKFYSSFYSSFYNKVLKAVMKKNLARRVETVANPSDDSMPGAFSDCDANRLIYRNTKNSYRGNCENDKRIMDPWLLEKKSSILADSVASSILADASNDIVLQGTSSITFDDNRPLMLATASKGAKGQGSPDLTSTVSPVPHSENDYGLALFDDLNVDERLKSYTKVIEKLEQAQSRKQNKRKKAGKGL